MTTPSSTSGAHRRVETKGVQVNALGTNFMDQFIAHDGGWS